MGDARGMARAVDLGARVHGAAVLGVRVGHDAGRSRRGKRSGLGDDAALARVRGADQECGGGVGGEQAAKRLQRRIGRRAGGIDGDDQGGIPAIGQAEAAAERRHHDHVGAEIEAQAADGVAVGRAAGGDALKVGAGGSGIGQGPLQQRVHRRGAEELRAGGVGPQNRAAVARPHPGRTCIAQKRSNRIQGANIEIDTVVSVHGVSNSAANTSEPITRPSGAPLHTLNSLLIS
ncbi:hypothetical protein D1F64_03985 [Breoghania sp. L-A4]|nr:hypothetical protein D1F64_03985 [Breoghania sp. L-A4]